MTDTNEPTTRMLERAKSYIDDDAESEAYAQGMADAQELIAESIRSRMRKAPMGSHAVNVMRNVLLIVTHDGLWGDPGK